MVPTAERKWCGCMSKISGDLMWLMLEKPEYFETGKLLVTVDEFQKFFGMKQRHKVYDIFRNPECSGVKVKGKYYMDLMAYLRYWRRLMGYPDHDENELPQDYRAIEFEERMEREHYEKHGFPHDDLL